MPATPKSPEPPEPAPETRPAELPPDGPRGRRSFARLVVEDFRSVRRWLVLLGALALIATGVAVYAVLRSEESADEQRVEQLERRLAGAERRLGQTGDESQVTRLERVKADAADLRRLSDQLSRLDRRLRRAEGDVVDAVDTAASGGRGISRLERQIGDLSTRIDDIEDRQPGGN